MVTVEDSVKVIRIKTITTYKVNYIIRGIAEMFLQHIFASKVKKYVKDKIDTVVVYSPPLSLAAAGLNIKKKYKAKYLLNIQDIFPQNAMDLGIMNNRIAINYFQRIEKSVYEAADKITAHSENNMRFLIKHKGIPEEKISTLWNWIDLQPYKDLNRSGEYRKRYGLEDKFIFLFAGIMGPAQDLGFIVKVAKEIRSIKDICFLLVGDGTAKKSIQNVVKDSGLSNIVFKTFISSDEYPLLVKDADVGLACLSNRNKTPVYPGKILGFMAAGIPVVAFLNKESDGHFIIREAKCGYSMVSDNHKAAAELIIRIYKNRDRNYQYGLNGYKYALTHFSREACVEKLEKLLF